jgi:hypothetical protein
MYLNIVESGLCGEGSAAIERLALCFHAGGPHQERVHQ